MTAVNGFSYFVSVIPTAEENHDGDGVESYGGQG